MICHQLLKRPRWYLKYSNLYWLDQNCLSSTVQRYEVQIEALPPYCLLGTSVPLSLFSISSMMSSSIGVKVACDLFYVPTYRKWKIKKSKACNFLVNVAKWNLSWEKTKSHDPFLAAKTARKLSIYLTVTYQYKVKRDWLKDPFPNSIIVFLCRYMYLFQATIWWQS